MKIFLSYASEDKAAADRIARTLRNDQHEVFFSEDALNVGDAYAREIRKSIEDSELFIFLISPDSVKERCFTLTELRFAEQKWKQPSGFVLPVEVKPTPYETVPAYLSTLTIWRAAGNLETELAAEVARIAETRGSVRMPPASRRVALVALASLIVGGLVGSYPIYACRLNLPGCQSESSTAVIVSVQCIRDESDTSSRNIPKSAYVLIKGAFAQSDVDAALGRLKQFPSMASVEQVERQKIASSRFKTINRRKPTDRGWAVFSQLADQDKIDFPLPKLDPNQAAHFFVEFDDAPVTGDLADADGTIVATATGESNAPATGIRELANFALIEDGSPDDVPTNGPKITKVNLNLYQGKIDCWENSSP